MKRFVLGVLLSIVLFVIGQAVLLGNGIEAPGLQWPWLIRDFLCALSMVALAWAVFLIEPRA